MLLLPIDMPERCIDCPCYEVEFSSCNITKDDITGTDEYDKRMDNCPLVEMPTHKVMSMSEQEIKEFRKYINGDWEITTVDK